MFLIGELGLSQKLHCLLLMRVIRFVVLAVVVELK